MALRRTDTIGLGDLPVLVLLNELRDAAGPNRLVPCPFDGYVERISMVAGGEVGQGAGTDYDCDLLHIRNGVTLSTTAIDMPEGTGGDVPVEFSYNSGTSPIEFACGDVLEFDMNGDGSTIDDPVCCTLILKRT